MSDIAKRTTLVKIFSFPNIGFNAHSPAFTPPAAAFINSLSSRLLDFFREFVRRALLKSAEVYLSGKFRAFLIVVAFLSLIAARLITHSFGLSLGYLYIVVISLAGFWFGLRKGLTAAILATLIFIAEVVIFRDWPYRDLVLQGVSFRLLSYFLSGIVLGYISDIENVMKEKLRDLACHDELTGCVNYRWSMQLLKGEIERSERYNKEMAIAIIDIDHFKEINDTYGHLAGNDILKAFVDVLKNGVRSMDTIGRYGGEEFIMVFPENNSSEALVAIDRIRDKLASLNIASPHLQQGLSFPIKFSAGIVSFPSNGRDLESLINIADEALYRAKRQGRGQTVIDRRRWKRIKPTSDIKIELIEPSSKKCLQPLKISDISQRGMLLVFPDDIPAGELLFKIRFPGEEFISGFKCKVVRKKTENDYCCAGVYFIDIPVDIEGKILRHIQEL